MSEISIRVLIADDERLARASLIDLVGHRPGWHLSVELENGSAFADKTLLPAFDVAFLDIRMPGLDGIEVARRIAGNQALVVFVTAYSEYALPAFGVDAFGFLVKPFSDQDFNHIAERIEAQLALEKRAIVLSGLARYLEISSSNGRELIQYRDIIWAQSDRNYLRIHTSAGLRVVRGNISTYFHDGELDFLMRVHRSAILNLHHVSSVVPVGASRWQAIMADGGRAPVSATRVKSLKEALLSHS
ncbi:MAG: LytTR family DNA-binding domain-containing protein [Wenzhouxiangellaceae bacterium]